MDAPGVHGAAVAGMHGIGVNVPIAAAVAAATCGFAGLWHIPKGAMFTIGLKSMIVAADCWSPSDMMTGRTVRLDGDVPMLQFIWAPLTTSFGMRSAPSVGRKL